MPSSARLPAKSEPGTGLGVMITINAGCVTLGTPIFGYIVDRQRIVCNRPAGTGSISNGDNVAQGSMGLIKAQTIQWREQLKIAESYDSNVHKKRRLSRERRLFALLTLTLKTSLTARCSHLRASSDTHSLMSILPISAYCSRGATICLQAIC